MLKDSMEVLSILAVFLLCVSSSQGEYVYLRVVGGSALYEGRVEVFHNGTWGTVCNHGWDMDDVRVVCRMLGLYSGYSVEALSSGFFGRGSSTQPIHLDNVECSGDETNIGSCAHNGWGTHTCSHDNDAGVRCLPAGYRVRVRLVNGTRPYEGRVEVAFNGTWGTICDNYWDINNARVVCRMLGLPDGPNVQFFKNAHFGAGPAAQPILLDHIHCIGSEINIDLCTHSPWGRHACSHWEDAGVSCLPDSTSSPATVSISTPATRSYPTTSFTKTASSIPTSRDSTSSPATVSISTPATRSYPTTSFTKIASSIPTSRDSASSPATVSISTPATRSYPTTSFTKTASSIPTSRGPTSSAPSTRASLTPSVYSSTHRQTSQGPGQRQQISTGLGPAKNDQLKDSAPGYKDWLLIGAGSALALSLIAVFVLGILLLRERRRRKPNEPEDFKRDGTNMQPSGRAKENLYLNPAFVSSSAKEQSSRPEDDDDDDDEHLYEEPCIPAPISYTKNVP